MSDKWRYILAFDVGIYHLSPREELVIQKRYYGFRDTIKPGYPLCGNSFWGEENPGSYDNGRPIRQTRYIIWIYDENPHCLSESERI
jgi:hypothetical protein